MIRGAAEHRRHGPSAKGDGYSYRMGILLQYGGFSNWGVRKTIGFNTGISGHLHTLSRYIIGFHMDHTYPYVVADLIRTWSVQGHRLSASDYPPRAAGAFDHHISLFMWVKECHVFLGMVDTYHLSKWWWLGDGADGIVLPTRLQFFLNNLPISFGVSTEVSFFPRLAPMATSCNSLRPGEGGVGDFFSRNGLVLREYMTRPCPDLMGKSMVFWLVWNMTFIFPFSGKFCHFIIPIDEL